MVGGGKVGIRCFRHKLNNMSNIRTSLLGIGSHHFCSLAVFHGLSPKRIFVGVPTPAQDQAKLLGTRPSAHASHTASVRQMMEQAAQKQHLLLGAKHADHTASVRQSLIGLLAGVR